MSEEITKDFEKIVPRRWKRYPRYKDSGIEWIGEIPEGWGVEKLKYLAVITMGQSPNSENCNKSGKGIPFLQGNADFGPIHPTANNFCTSFQKTTKAGEVLLSVRAPVGEVNIADQEYAIGRGLCSLDPVKLNRDYLVYFLQSCRPFLMSISTGSTFDAISASDVRELMLPSTQNEEQERISRFLNRVIFKTDTLISKKQRLIELLKEKRAAIITQAVTKGLDHNAPMKDSGVEWIGEIPDGWGVAKLKRAVNHVGRGISPKYAEKSSIAVINQACIYWEGICEDDLKYHEETDISELRKGLLKKGDLLLNSTGTGTLGRALLFNLDRMCVADSHVTIVRCDRKLLIPSFLRLLVETPLYQSKILNELVAGSTNQIELSREKLRDLIVVLPPIGEQERIVAYVTERNYKLDFFISKIEKSIELLKEYRSALITAAVTGKIDVREEVP